ncbi:Transcription elongation factor 1-like protein [Aphelenchoides fujianensis]|nr:Transcription elongation factor 1-like protein [Aphelenchoides fujianensis]
MAKKKSKRKAPTKAKIIEPLDTQFNCPFCNHEKVCEVKLQVLSSSSSDRIRNIGFIECRVCTETFQTSINYLSEPIDVYSDWIDACESVNR